VVKFQGDRSRELGERVTKQKKHLGQNISPSGTVVPGGQTKIALYIAIVENKTWNMQSESGQSGVTATINSIGEQWLGVSPEGTRP